ncbi:MAG: hypothetical protein ACE5HT_04330 [Gemmatimonadales bacterium]
MPKRSPQIAVCVTDQRPRELVLDCATSEGAVSQVVSVDYLWHVCHDEPFGVGQTMPWDILVYDLGPHDETAVELITCLMQHRPERQVLIYTHPTPGVGKLITAALKLEGVALVHRFDDGHDRLELHHVLQELLTHRPARLIHTLIGLLTGSTPRRGDSFIGQALEQVRTTAPIGSVTVADICHIIGTMCFWPSPSVAGYL